MPLSAPGPRAALRDVRMVVSDMDGTLLGPGHAPPAAALAAVARAEARGVRFAVATGRCRASAHQRAPSLSLLTRPGVYLNGAVAYGAGGAVVHERTLPAALVADLLRWAAAHPELAAGLAQSGDRVWTPDPAHPVARHLHDEYGDPLPEPLPAAAPPRAVHLVHLCCRAEAMPALRRAVDGLCRGRARVSRNLPTDLCVVHPRSSKLDGLARLCDGLGLDPARHLATIGDGENDLEMIRGAALGCAVGNAPEAVRTAAACVVARNDAAVPGVAQLLDAVPGPGAPPPPARL